MDIETARSAYEAKAFVRGNRKDGAQHSWMRGRVSELRGSTLTIRVGSACRDFDIRDVELDKCKNAEAGIRISPPDKGPANDAPKAWVILDTQQWIGFGGPEIGWTVDYDKWQRFESFDAAEGTRIRMAKNGINGCKTLTFDAAFERFYQHNESVAATPKEQSAPTGQSTANAVGKILGGGMRNARDVAELWRQAAQITEEDANDERDIFNDRDNNMKLEKQVLELKRLIQVGERRIEEAEQRRVRRKSEMAGLTARLAATLGQ